MNALPATSTIPPSPSSQYGSGGLQDADIDEFLKLMIAELQNQDPLNPLKNNEMLQQLNEIRSISATDKLTDTLDAVLIGQNVSTASSLIGKEIKALTDAGNNIQGIVGRVSVSVGGDEESKSVRVHIGEESVALNNIREILPVSDD
jgi:flagellar basal-body rod modification protein FlgD